MMEQSGQVVSGLEDLQRFLDQLPAKVEKNILRGAMRAGAKVQLARARELVPAETEGPHPGALRASLRIGTSARGGIVKAKVVAGGAKAFWAPWVEFGTLAHYIKPRAAKSLFFAGIFGDVIHHPGAKKKPFMRPALDATVGAAVLAVGNYIRGRLTKEGLEVPGPENT